MLSGCNQRSGSSTRRLPFPDANNLVEHHWAAIPPGPSAASLPVLLVLPGGPSPFLYEGLANLARDLECGSLLEKSPPIHVYLRVSGIPVTCGHNLGTPRGVPH